MRKFKPKPTKANQRNKALIMKAFLQAVSEAISKLDSYEAAQYLESMLYQARTGGLISDKEYVAWSGQIKEVCKKNNWAMP